MTRTVWSALALAGMLLLVFGAVCVSNVAPTATDLELTTWERNAITFAVEVSDLDIDLADSDHDTIRFEVSEAPENGVVTSDFDGVLYEEDGARLVMSYVPSRTFVGTDRFVVLATDAAGEAVRILVTVVVQPLESAGTLAGDVLSTATFDSTLTHQIVVSSSFAANIVYRITGVQFQTGFLIKQDSAADELFDDLYFSMRFPIDAIGSFYTKLDFDPNTTTPLFESGTASLTLGMGGLSTAASLRTNGTTAGSSFSLSASGALDGIYGGTLSSSLSLATCSPVLKSGSVTLSFANLGVLCSEACEDVAASFTMSYDCSGFTGFNITASNVHLPLNIPYASYIDGSVSIGYTLQTASQAKTLSLSLGLDSIVMDCFSVSTELIATGTGNPGIGGLEINALHMDCEFPGGILFESDTSLDPNNLPLNNSVTGHSDYWERDRLSGRFEVCEGIGGSWQLSVYFERPGVGTTLFNWGMGTFEAEVYCHQVWRLFGMATIRSGSFGGPIWEALLGFSTRW